MPISTTFSLDLTKPSEPEPALPLVPASTVQNLSAFTVGVIQSLLLPAGLIISEAVLAWLSKYLIEK